jgi:hypothetical protein
MASTSGELRVYDPNHRPIGTIPNIKGVQIAWLRNDIGTLQFTMAAAGLRWSTQYIRQWYRYEYHHPDLPVWTGVLIDPGEGTGGEATPTLQAAEIYYKKRFTDLWWQDIGTGGALAENLHRIASRRYPFGVVLGGIANDGPEYYSEYELKNVYDALTELAERTGGDFWIEKTGHTHGDPWRFNWSAARGADLSASVLVSGDVVDRPDHKQPGGDMANFLHVIGGGTGSSLEERLYIPVFNQASIDVYGLLEDRTEYKDIEDPTLLEEAGLRELYRRMIPERQIALNVDNRRGGFGSFWLGDTIRAILYRVGFVGLDVKVRVNGIQYDVDAGKLGLTVEIV